MRPLLVLVTIALVVESAYIRNTRRAIPQELYRDNVEPAKGGKVPEAAHMRIELNKLDAAGLESGEGLRMMEELVESAIVLPDKAGSSYNPGYSPPLKLKPGYAPEEPSYTPDPDPYAPYTPVNPGYNSAPAAYAPADPYAPVGYEPSPYAPEPYSPPEPIYQKPVGPVLLEKRPYEVKSVQPLPITVAESYTNFDCRSVPYFDRHYADPEAGCELYHFCHADGKQDTFRCGYGTVFNEYLGTCDYKNNVHCGEQVVHAAPVVHAPVVHSPAPYHDTPYQSFGTFSLTK